MNDREDDLDSAKGVLAAIAIGASVWALALLIVWVMP